MCMYLKRLIEWILGGTKKEDPIRYESAYPRYEYSDELKDYIKRKIDKRIVDIETRVNINEERLDHITYRMLKQLTECECNDQKWHAYL